MPIVESTAANFSNISIENKENIRIGWGTDTTQGTFGNDPDVKISDQRNESTGMEGSVSSDNKNILQTAMKYPRNAAMDTSINDVKKSVVQPHDTRIHTQTYMYFVSKWEKVLRDLKEISKNWKTVREYILIGIVAILISIFCVLNLMYK